MAIARKKIEQVEYVNWDGKKSTLDEILTLLAKSGQVPEVRVSYDNTGFTSLTPLGLSLILKLTDYLVLTNNELSVISSLDFEKNYEDL